MVRKIFKSQKGFTLIELLIAVGILAILAGVAVPVVTKFTSSSQTKAAAAELASVQTAVDALMVDEGVSTLAAPDCTLPVAATSTMTAFPCTGVGEPVLSPIYLRNAATTGTYTVAANGTVTQATTGY